MNLLILITTYNRPQMLMDLLKDIKKQSEYHEIQLIVFNDGSNKDYSSVQAYIRQNFHAAVYRRFEENFGKPRYWERINELYGLAYSYDFDYAIQLQDDVRLVKNFFGAAISYMNIIPAKSGMCLNILNDGRPDTNWTNFKSSNVVIKGQELIRAGWVDQLFIANRNFFELLSYKIYPVPKSWTAVKNRSSGVGMQISRRIINKGLHFYQVPFSLVIHDDHPSLMHPEHRKLTPLISNQNAAMQIQKDIIFGGMATMPARIDALREAVASILPQLDRLFVYLNDFDRVPEFLLNDKITAYLSSDYAGDLGDVGKFFMTEKIKGYRLLLDDDFIYAPNYVATLIKGIETFKRRAFVSLQGRIINKWPVPNYYHADCEYFRALGVVPGSKAVHIPGTGVAAYHTDIVDISYTDFEHKNMADIYVGVLCQRKRIPVYVLAHPHGIVKNSNKYDQSYTIYNAMKNNDPVQRDMVNSLEWQLYHVK